VVAVVKIRHVRMCMLERRVLVPVRVRFSHRFSVRVSVLMMLVVYVTMVVLERLVGVRVSVLLIDQ
jgi:hypothetical protein